MLFRSLALVPFRSRRTYDIATLGDYPQLAGSFPSIFVSGWQGSNIHQQPLHHRLTGGQLLPRQYGLIHAQAPLSRGYGLFYTSTTEQGMSGGPILDTEGQVIGIHGRSEGEEFSSSAGLTRLHWGFSSGLPLPDNLTTQLRSPIRWRHQTQPPPPPNPSDRASYAALGASPQETPTDVAGWVNLGNQLYRQEQFEQALFAFEQALNQQPGHITATMALAQSIGSFVVVAAFGIWILRADTELWPEIGRASGRERGEISVVGVSFKKKKKKKSWSCSTVALEHQRTRV